MTFILDAIPASQFLLDTSREYAIYICRQRAIPFVGDGLKHGQMIALWLLRNRAEKIKTVALGGLMAYERLYVHGDKSANDSIGYLAAPFKNNVPLIEGLGQFGSRVAPDAIGEPRYTEVRRAQAAEELLYHDLDIVPLEDNYDGSNKQPMHFLPLIPLVLLNGIKGIAIGWSTNILPRDLKALIAATKDALMDKPIDPIPPSYSQINCTVTNLGVNKWEFGGRLKVNDGSVHITELPPEMPIEDFGKRLIEMENEGLIKEYTDRSTETIDIQVVLKRNSALEEEAKPMTEKLALEFFKLRERVTERIVVVDWNGNSIKTYDNAEDVIKAFVKWRLGWYTVRYKHYTERDAYELRYWQALNILFKSDFLTKLGTFANRTEMQNEIAIILKGKLTLDDSQMDRVLNLVTYRWTKEFAAEVEKRILDLEAALDEYKAILKSPAKLRDVYIKELSEIKIK